MTPTLAGPIVFLLALLIGPQLGLAQSSPPPPRIYRAKNGIRLVGGNGARGRLEVSSLDSWFSDGGRRPSWSPVCDTPNFTDEDVLIMCKLLTYNYGRKYYSPALAYRKNDSFNWFVGSIDCVEKDGQPPPPPDAPSAPSAPVPFPDVPVPSYGPAVTPAGDGGRRRHRHRQLNTITGLTGGGSAAAATAAAVEQHQHQHHPRRHLRQQHRSARARELYSPLRGTINTPRLSPYSCSIKPGDCTVKGPFVGIECSHTPLVDAPPPPPFPPQPPPAPPAGSLFIRSYGPDLTYYTKVDGPVEPNLVDELTMMGTFYGRFEGLVVVNGTSVWAPLCAPPQNSDDPYLSYMLSEIACNQVYDWPKPFDGGIGYVQAQPSDSPFPIPSGPYSPGDFDPSTVSAWINVVGGDYGSARKIQDLDLRISSTPCNMLAVACLPFGERRRQ